MKTLVIFVGVMLTLTGCDLYIVEPRIDYRDHVVGFYEVEEYSQTYGVHTHYGITISKSSYSYGSLRIHNFYGANLTVLADLYNNMITIPEQYVDGYRIEGTGTVVNGYIRFSFSVRDTYSGTRTDFCESEAYFSY